MKTILLHFLLITAVISFYSCDDSEKPKTIPVVTTSDQVTDITTTSATASGEIADDGNAEVIVTGVVYSNEVDAPTISNGKVELTDTEGNFSAVLEGLSSGTTYHIRAYATNSVGTGYGAVVDFTTSNAAPTVTNVSITGELKVNKELTATYTYNDAESDAQSGSVFQWYVANDGTGAGEAAIAGATGLTFVVQEAQQGKHIRFGVIPHAGAGTVAGAEVKSSFTDEIGEATTVTFMYNGQQVTYGIIKSTTTQRRWLDRNLGASGVPTAVDNYQNYGDIFQWGRLADGHQLITHSGINEANFSGVNGTTSTVAPFEYSANDSPGHNKFIVVNSSASPFDWRTPQNNNLWQGIGGASNSCPSGWRIPTQEEWTAENITTITDGFTKLKITYTGFRVGTTGAFSSATAGGYFWSSTISNTTDAIRIRFNTTSFNTLNTLRAGGYACRCIKD